MPRSNISKLYALIIAQDALTIVPVFVPYMAAHGITLEQVFLLQGIYTFTWVATDIPTGYFADMRSRRQSLVAGSFFLCLSGIGFACGSQFWQFCLVEFLFGLGRAFNCGSIQAMTYDTLIDLDDTGSYRKICTSQNIVSFLSTAIAGIIGGLAAEKNIQLSGALMLPFFLVALCIALAIDEPKRHRQEHTGHIKNIVRLSYETLFLNPPLRAVILAYGLTAAMTFGLVWFTQPYQAALHMPIRYFGLSNAACMAGMMIASRGAYLLEKRLDDRLFLIMVIAVALSSYFILGLSVSALGFCFMVIGRSSYGALDPLTSDMINHLTTSDRRATVLSMRSFLYNLIFTVFSPLIGYAAGAFSLNGALLMVGIGGSIIAIPLAFLMKTAWKALPA